MSYKPAMYFRYPCLQINFEKSWYDYYCLSFFFPFVEAGKFREQMDIEENAIYSINAPTTISLVKSKVHLGFKIQILGFGVGILRQNGF